MNVTGRLRQHAIRHLFSFLFISILLAVSGCQNAQPVEKTTGLSVPSTGSESVPAITPMAPATQSVKPEPTPPETGSVSSCQRELVALSKINQRLYAQKKAAFDELLTSASVYTGVREDITAQTKDTMDAFYKFKTQKICSDIEQAVRQALINRVENMK